MATGVHSTIRTSAQRRVPQRQSLFQRLRAAGQRVSPRQKLAVIGLAAALLAVGLTWHLQQRAHEPRQLFARSLTAAEVEEVSTKLDELEIDHQLNVTKDNLLVAPEQAASIRRQLQRAGVPHTSAAVPDDNPLGGMKTRAELEELRHNRIAERLSQQIQGMDGVQSARVNLALTEQLFQEEAPSTASVMLTMRPGQVLGVGLASSITRLVSGAVTGLSPEDVALVDASGQTLKLGQEKTTDSLQQELQKKLDQYLEAKAQSLLDKLPGQAKVVVSAEYDLSQVEIKRTDVGLPGQGEVITVDNTKTEKYVNGQPGDEEGKPGREYEHIVEARRAEHDRSFTWTVHKLPRIQRLSCSVLVDTPLRNCGPQIRELIASAVGLDESRGDKLSLVSIPMTHPAPVQTPAPAPAPAVASNLWIVPVAFLVGCLPVVAILLVFLVKEHRVRVLRTEYLMVDHTGPVDLIDPLINPKGHPQETRVSVCEQLEKVARRNPGPMAELLKSTWLS